MNSAELLSAYEVCPRKAYLASRWQRNKLSTVQTLRESLYRVLAAPEAPAEASWGQMAGETVLDLAASPGIDISGENVYACAMNLANLADIILTAIRKPDEKPWHEESIQNWTSYLSPEGDKLRRLVIVSHWSQDRHYSECRNWFTFGPMAAFRLPMDLVVLIIGNERNGRRHSHWCKALLHPANKKQLRFRRRVGNTSGGFKESWVEIWREDHEEISRETWLNCMLADDVLRDCCFTIHMPQMPPEQCQYYMELAARKMEMVQAMREKPPLQLTGCDFPVKCQFLKPCHDIPEKDPSEKLGFVRIKPLRLALCGD
jgi:hypothetical protein